MAARLTRVILYVHDVDKLSAFYREAFGFVPVEEIAGEWAVLGTGAGELALHRVGPAYRGMTPAGESNAKLVFAIDTPVADTRQELMRRGVSMGEMKSYGNTGPLCDGRDPEGNVFQLAQAN
jgi:catechol 2,3-dioxygenase-like lactoylglutathione lyase family enzyme